MKIYKKFAGIMALGLVAQSFSGVYASETKKNTEAYHYNHVTKAVRSSNTTSSTITSDTTKPTIGELRTIKIDSKTYVMVHVEDYGSGIKRVEMNSKTATKRSGNNNSADYYVEIGNSNYYTIKVVDNNNNERIDTKYLQINDSQKPTVELSQTFKNNSCYLVIEAHDNVSIASVTVNGSEISFDENGGTENYKVTQSKTYTVVVKDIAGNTTTEKFDVDIDNSKPSLTVDKTLKNGKWYLTIKATPSGSAKISKVTVNNAKVGFRTDGDTVEYAVSATGDYKVVVTDNYNQQATQNIHVDTSAQGTTVQPTLTVTQKNVGGVMCLSITAAPNSNITNNSLSSVTVNGAAINLPANGGTVDYNVLTTGTYTVVATDKNGNTNTQSAYVTIPTVSSTNQSTPQVSQGSASASSKVTFTLNQKTWTKNGVSQAMDAAPIARSGRIYIPIRYVAYALNIDSSKVTWDTKTRAAIIYDGGNTIKVPLGSKVMSVNGVSQTMEAAAISYNGRIYIPISQIRSAFSGVQMSWNNSSKQITVTR